MTKTYKLKCKWSGLSILAHTLVWAIATALTLGLAAPLWPIDVIIQIINRTTIVVVESD